MFECNAQITSTSLGYEDHGILTCWLQLKYGSGGQGFGGYGLDGPPLVRFGNDREPSVHCGFWIARILDTVGVEKWEDLKGKHIRVAKADEWGLIDGIGHITEDKWFHPKSEILQRYPERQTA
jgi:hypothetical protein